MFLNNDLIAKALRLAAMSHKDDTRKGKELPYIVHPVEVAMILQENGMDDDIIIAGLLHDTLEDTSLTKNEIKKEFDKRIADLVVAASEKLDNRDDIPWKERKKHTLEFLKNAEREVKILSCADKLSNAKSMLKDLGIYENDFWERFNAGYEQQKWYYMGLIESLKSLEGNEIYEEFKRVVYKIFQ